MDIIPLRDCPGANRRARYRGFYGREVFLSRVLPSKRVDKARDRTPPATL